MQIDIIFRIAAIGILLAVLNQVLIKAEKSEIATLVPLAGVIIVLLMVLDMVSNLFTTIRSLFQLY